MQLDLAAYQATSLYAGCTLQLSEDEFRQVSARLPEDALVEERLVRHCDYRIGRRRYHEAALVRALGDGSYSLTIQAFSHSGERESAGTVEDLLEAIAPLSKAAKFDCEVDFAYPSRGWSSIVRLPLRFSDWGQAFDEVRGVRVVKVSAGRELEYSAILDRPRSRDYVLSLYFAYESVIEPSVAERLMLEATRISGLLVRPKRTR